MQQRKQRKFSSSFQISLSQENTIIIYSSSSCLSRCLLCFLCFDWRRLRRLNRFLGSLFLRRLVGNDVVREEDVEEQGVVEPSLLLVWVFRWLAEVSNTLALPLRVNKVPGQEIYIYKVPCLNPYSCKSYINHLMVKK